MNTNAPTLAHSPIALASDKKTVMPPVPQEHLRQLKIGQHQHIKQTLQQLHESDDLFLDNIITHTKDKHAAIAKGDTNNVKCVAILDQRCHNTAYCLGSAFNWAISKLIRNKHVSFTKQNKVHLYDATTTPSIMLTYDSGADGYYISKQDQCKAGLPFCILPPDRLGLPMVAQAKQNMPLNSHFTNYLLE